MEDPLLGIDDRLVGDKAKKRQRNRTIALCLVLFLVGISGFSYRENLTTWLSGQVTKHDLSLGTNVGDVIESENGVVAADDGRCSEIGASVLRRGGHAVDAAVATSLCLGVVNPMASGIGGGAFMIVASPTDSKAQAFDMRETAPLTASKDMYKNDENAKSNGALSVGVPGEIAGLYKAWRQYGRSTWKSLFQPAIELARDGFIVAPYLDNAISSHSSKIMNDPGLRKVFAPKGRVLRAGETCYNKELAKSLEAVAENGPLAFYHGPVGEKLVGDVRKAGGIITMEDLRSYEVGITDAMAADAMGFTIHGMPPPSSGTVGFTMILNILDSYTKLYAADRNLGLHRLVEAMKHMFAARMDLGDPAFVNTTNAVNRMLSRSHANEIQKKIFDNTTFPPEYYFYRWNQLRDHGTSHFSIVDSDRNTVSMTTSVNYVFGSGFLSPSTGIILNNEMDDFSVPTEKTPDKLPPAPANFIEPNKRPLSSMTPLVITKDGQLVAALGGSGGMNIIPAVVQVFLNCFVLGMKPRDAVQSSRVYHRVCNN
ncbi:PREDICTED: gamma-glutamyltranspeptidase 3 isoform X2 [Tarenaya hassleriana]|uniref:gamma-glutamyltranspeptidase 3 isoform X2 n=1 Tax=Tarenaya hassleriana TaxID=28532 RepID=UPI00053C5AD5|nr:PREDICTED: gamma-glutamyltranspeptidase 3 isoform X2 [Tarenaya hassleriana]